MTPPSTLAHLIELSIALEQNAEAIYHALALRFAHVPEVAAFWQGYADEENGHALWLEKLRSQMDPEKKRQVLERADAMVDGAYKLLAQPTEAVLAGITDLEQALQAAVAMENGETNAIFEFLVADLATGQLSQEFLREQIHRHVEKLQSGMPEGYRDANSRRQVKAILAE